MVGLEFVVHGHPGQSMILVFGTPPEVAWVLHDAKTDRSRFSTRSPALCVEAERLRRCGQS